MPAVAGAPGTRKAAALHLGDIVKYHPYDLNNVLHRVCACLLCSLAHACISCSRYTPICSTKHGKHVLQLRRRSKPLLGMCRRGMLLLLPRVCPAASAALTPQCTGQQAVQEQHTAAAPTFAGATKLALFDTFDIVKLLQAETPLVASGGEVRAPAATSRS